MRLPHWTQEADGRTYPVLVVHPDWAAHWAAALTHAEYQGLEWVVRRDTWLVGCEPGLGYLAPSFDGIEAPDWAFDTGD